MGFCMLWIVQPGEEKSFSEGMHSINFHMFLLPKENLYFNTTDNLDFFTIWSWFLSSQVESYLSRVCVWKAMSSELRVTEKIRSVWQRNAHSLFFEQKKKKKG